jgi:hypothetical protein
VAALPEAAGKKIYVTGHDLGGVEAEAQAAAITSIAGGVTFGAAGLPNNTNQGTAGNLVNLVDAGDAFGLWASDTPTLQGIADDSVLHYGPVRLIGPDADARFAKIADEMHKSSISESLVKVVSKTVDFLPEKYKKLFDVALPAAGKFADRYDGVVNAAEYSFLAYAAYRYHSISVYADDLGVNLNPKEPVVPESDAAKWWAKEFDSKLTKAQVTQVGETDIAASGVLKAPDIDLTPKPGAVTIPAEKYSLPSSDAQFTVSYDPAEQVSTAKVNNGSVSYEVLNDDLGTHRWSAAIDFYSKPGEAGKLTAKIYNWDSGGSQLQLFVDLPSGVTEQTRNYSGPDATGKLLSVHNN